MVLDELQGLHEWRALGFADKRRDSDPDSLLFVMPEGAAIVTLIDQLNAAFRDAGIERSNFGERYAGDLGRVCDEAGD